VTATAPILIVEDDEDLRDTIVDALHLHGFDTVTARHGAEALDVLATIRPALIVLDLMMPVMDGHAFLDERARNEELREIPVVVTSTKPPPSREDDLSKPEFVAKPFTVAALTDAINRLAGSR
jgi:CheY-like chemotaxis protein